MFSLLFQFERGGLAGPVSGTDPRDYPGGSEEKDASREEAVDYYEKWLNDTVVHIIAHDERTVFEN